MHASRSATVLRATIGGLLTTALATVAPRARAEMRTLPVTTERGGSWPVLCADGKSLAYMASVDRSGELFVFDLSDTTKPARAITNHPKWDGKPSWAPDCKRIAFMSGRSGDEDIWVYSFETGAYTQMTFSHEGPGLRAQEWGPAWSPDGSRIAFSSDRSGDDDLWWVPASGGDPRRITKRTLSRARDQERYPSWSPDGTRIAYASQTSGNWDIWIASVDDTAAAPARVTADSTGEWAPSWSPNGRWIAFVSDRTGNLDIFVVPAEGGAAKQLTQNPGPDNTPSWSPDGKRIFYAATREEVAGIWAIDGLEDLLGADFAAPRPKR